MRGYMAFVKKEAVEQVRRYHILVLGIVFIFFGVSSAVLAKLLPELLKGMEIQGMTIAMQDPTAMDAYAQFYKNITQMGTVVLLLVFGGTLSGELSKGTLINVLTKGLSRDSVILAKYTMMILMWTGVYSITAAIFYGYTAFLFPKDEVSHVFYAFFMFWLFGVFLFAVLLLGSVILRGNYGGILFTVIVLAVLLLVSMFPQCEKFNPITLASINCSILEGSKSVGDTVIPMLITITSSVGSILLSLLLFRKKAI